VRLACSSSEAFGREAKRQHRDCAAPDGGTTPDATSRRLFLPTVGAHAASDSEAGIWFASAVGPGCGADGDAVMALGSAEAAMAEALASLEPTGGGVDGLSSGAGSAASGARQA
jgi:hypothetical protein